MGEVGEDSATRIGPLPQLRRLNMPIRITTLRDIAGGMSESPFSGYQNQTAKSWSVDYRSEPGIYKLGRTPTTEKDQT